MCPLGHLEAPRWRLEGRGLDTAMRSSFQEAPWLLPSSLKVSETGWRECQGDDVAPPKPKNHAYTWEKEPRWPFSRKARIYHQPARPGSDGWGWKVSHGHHWCETGPPRSLIPCWFRQPPSLALLTLPHKPADISHPRFPSCFVAAPLPPGV